MRAYASSMSESLSDTLPTGGLAVVLGASGTIGGAHVRIDRSMDVAIQKEAEALQRGLPDDARFADVVELSRSGDPSVDLTDEASLAEAAARIKERGLDVRLILVASGFLHDEQQGPEKTWRHLDPDKLARSFALNAIGPALALKHLLPLLPRKGRVIVGALSARAGSLSENTLGGWYGYRASKAALNQIVRSAAAELGRKNPQAVCVTLHPGHVESPLSAPFGAGGNETLTPDASAGRLLGVLDALSPEQSGGFFDVSASAIPF